MKKWKIVLSLLVVVLLFSSHSFAASKYSYTTMNFNGRNQKVRSVPVLIDGKSVDSDIPSFIYKDSTLVPVRFIANGLGADVKWNQKNKTVIITDKGKEVILGIESSDVFINGQKQKLPNNVPAPKLVNDSRTMVPIRFISETLGYNVSWDNNKGIVNIKSGNGEEAEVNNISIDNTSEGLLKVKISGSKSFDYKTMKLESPSRLVIDIPNSKLQILDQGKYDSAGIINIPVGQTPINQVSASQFTVNPNATRVVIHLTEDIDYKINQSSDKRNLEILFPKEANEVEKPENPPVITQPTQPVQPSIKFVDIKMENVNGEDAIVIYNSSIPKINKFEMANPNRMVIDLLDSTVDLEKQKKYDYNLGVVKSVRVSQFNPDSNYKPDDKIVRVVLDIVDGSNPNVKIIPQGNKIILTPEKNSWEGIDFSKVDNERKLIISALKDTKYNINYDSIKKVLEISIPAENTKLNNGQLNVGDNLIDNIVIKEESGYKKVLVNFKRSVIHKVLSKEIDNEIVLTFIRDMDVSPSERLIVIDPGHGGKDPGASSPNGTREKDITISISNKLNESLKALGYNTIMTRYDDSYLELYDRTDIANNNNADIFVSVHSNSFPNNRNVSGLEVLYHPDKQEGDGSSYDLAKMMQEEVLKTTGLYDRGIVKRPKLAVLRTSKMPAALIEVGFLSNEGDEALIKNSEFQDKVVEGIVKAIERYFMEY